MAKINESLFNENRTGIWAEVILPLALPKVYTYIIPDALKEKAKPGFRAEVVFGKNKKYAGIIKKIITEEPPYPTKPLLNILDDEPLVYHHQLALWEWMAEYYMCTEGEVMAAALPSNFKLSSETILIFNEDISDDFSALDNEEYLVAEALQIRKQLVLTEIQQILDGSRVYPVIKKLLEKNICFSWEKLNERYKIKKETFVFMNPEFENEENLGRLLNDWKGAPKQMELLLSFIHLQRTGNEVLKSELLKKSNASASQFNALCEKNILVAEKKAVDRLNFLPKKINIDFLFSEAQQKAFENINHEFQHQNVCLLHGVTGSGKTQVYIKLIEIFLNEGKQILYLLPEIALTSQIIRRLQKFFGGHIAVYHSKFNDQERIELWNKVRKGEVSIVLGARSALFLPFTNLGFVIVDEEHDASFKQQDPAPRYHARDAAIYYAALFKAKVLLGSGTPSLESYFNAQQKKYGFVELNERYGGLMLPEIEIVNSGQVAQTGKVMISPQLKEAMEKTLGENKQIILFQNRRGYNPYMICGTCGFIPQCEHCDVSLTLHKYSNKLHCHYCGSNYPKLKVCTACGSTNWLEKNFGTEKIEEVLDHEFPKHKIGRMDVDSVKGKMAHDNLIQSFEQQRLDILVGTQMVVKGLDFDNVGLVGILDADGLLSFADFRVNERAFQLMEQVSGRAGRKNKRGKVVIQALNTRHPVIKMVEEHDYRKMYQLEIASRKEFSYPPFSRMVKLTLKHKVKDVVEDAASALSKSLRSDFSGCLIGPASPIIGRIRNQYLMEILIKLPKENGNIAKYKKVVLHHMNLLLSEKKYRSIIIVADADPV